MNPMKDVWNNNGSYMLPDGDGQNCYRGRVIVHGAEFRFSLNRNTSGPYLYRGTMSAIYPDKENVIEVCLPADEISETKKISKSLYSNQETAESLKAYVSDCAYNLHARFSGPINRLLRRSVRKETIAPDVAFCLYGKAFVNYAYPNASEQTRSKYYDRLMKHYIRFPDMPMAEYTKKDMEKHLVSINAPRDLIRHLRAFWLYCLDKGYCAGDDPFPEKQMKKRSPKALTEKAVRPDELSEQTQEALYETCMERSDGLACAVALLLWGGLSPSAVHKLRWKDIVFDEDDPDKAYLLLLESDYAGATHIFNRPLFVQGARILRASLFSMLANYNISELKDMPPVCLTSDPHKEMSRDTMVKSISTLLRSCGVLNRTFAELKDSKNAVSMRLLSNTYCSNLIRKCGLNEDAFTYKFMRGESLRNSTTCDSYVSFTDDDAIDRLYTMIKVTKPVEEYENDMVTKSLEDGRTMYRIYPRNSKQCAGVTARMLVPPGAYVQVQNCFHGINGNVTVRAVGEDGKPKRKSRKKEPS